MLRGLDPLYLRAARLAPAPALRERPAPPRRCSPRAPRCSARAPSIARASPAQLAFLGARGRAPGTAALLRARHRGRPSRPSRATFAPACRRSGTRRRGRGDRASSPARATARRSRRAARRSSAREGHEYPYVDGIPVLVVDDELEPTQPGYWSNAEQIERVRAAVPPPVEGDAVDPYVAELILGTHGNLYKHLSRRPLALPDPGLSAPARQRRAAARHRLQLGPLDDRRGARRLPRRSAIDPSFEAIVAARRIARQLGVDAQYVVADARAPAVRGRDVRRRLLVRRAPALLEGGRRGLASTRSRRVLKPDGVLLGADAERARRAQRRAGSRSAGSARATHFEVRYWTPAELKRVFGRIGPTELTTDGFFTLNPQKRDLDLLPAPLPRGRAHVGGAEARIARADDARRQRQRALRARASGARLPARPAARSARRRLRAGARVPGRRRRSGAARRGGVADARAPAGRARGAAAAAGDRRRPVRAGGDRRDVRAPLRAPDRRPAEYPIPELRLPPGDGRSFLEVGCNWGRWCVARRAPRLRRRSGSTRR